MEAEKLITAQKELELQHHHFRERSQEGLVIDVTARARVEAKAEACWARLQQMQRESESVLENITTRIRVDG